MNSWRRRKFIAAVVLVAAATIHSQADEVPPDADSYYRSAWELQKQAEDSKSPQFSKTSLTKAIEQCDAATKIRPDFFRAHALAAHCLYRLAQLKTTRQEHRDSIQAARDRFEIAARCSGVDPALFREWGGMLISETKLHEDAPERLALLRDAKRVFESGLNLKGFSGEQGRLERDLGFCLLLIAQNVDKESEKRNLYEEALRRFGSAAQVDTVANTPQLSARWGIALVEYAKLTNDRMVLRQAVERLETALEQDARNTEARYNLVCAYALLEQPQNALRHLRVCLDNDDSKQTYYHAAVEDPDLNFLRHTREYNDLITEKRLTSPLVKPKISDR